MTDMLREYCDSRGVAMRVDRQGGVIRGVKVLGLQSRNGRVYLPDALRQAARLYEGAKVNVNHPRGNPGGPRDYQDRIGRDPPVSCGGRGSWFATLHSIPKRPGRTAVWTPSIRGQKRGLFAQRRGRCARRGDSVVVEAIVRVQSVDLVADPATTRGLFESQAAATGGADDAVPPRAEEVERPENQTAELQRLRCEVERLRAAEALRIKRDDALRLLREFKLADARDPLAQQIDNQRFVEILLTAADHRAMREMVEERAQLVSALAGLESRPRSKDQHQVYAVPPGDAKSFVETIT